MKKLLAAVAACLCLLAYNPAHAAGRLNFMLINLTGADIESARICPTYAPEYLSGNLLKTPLDPDTRIYIGPNYYGEQKFWNIILTWANGYEQTFRRMRLTRYNTYIAYSTPYGAVRLRQTYEPTYARNSFAPSYMMDGANMEVAVGLPEKINAPARPVAQVDPDKIGKSRRRATRDLVFDDDDADSAPVLPDSAASQVDGDEIAMKTTVELTRDGATTSVLPTEDFKDGDKARLKFSVNRDGHIYWLAKGASGQYQLLYPSKKAGMDNTVKRNQEYTVPQRGAWRFDNQKGTETLVAVLSPKPMPELDRAVKLAADGDSAAASKIVSRMINGNEKKRTTRDLVFEEEDDDVVNTKSQKANGDEPFVAVYELIHN